MAAGAPPVAAPVARPPAAYWAGSRREWFGPPTAVLAGAVAGPADGRWPRPEKGRLLTPPQPRVDTRTSLPHAEWPQAAVSAS